MPTAIITTDDLREFKMEILEGIESLLKNQPTLKKKKYLKSSELMELLQVSPGTLQTLRINGNAYITTEPSYLQQLCHQAVPPKLAILVDIKQVYFHCAKAFIRAKLWDAATQMPRDEMPSLGKIILEQIRGQVTVTEIAAVDDILNDDIKNNLYHT